MNYWLFDGSDVVGPFSPQELAAQTGFSSVSLLCPETQSETPDGWKTAASFADFEFDEQTGRCITAAKPSVQLPAGRRPEPAQIAHQAVRPSVAPPSSVTISTPITLAGGQDDFLQLPAAAQEAQEPPATKPETPPEQAPKTPPGPEEVSTCTLPTLPAALSAEPSGLTPLAQASTWPKEEPFAPQEAPFSPPPAAGQDKAEDTVKNIFAGSLTVAPVQAVAEPLHTLPLEGETQEIIKPRLTPTPEIREFLTRQQTARLPGHQKAKWMVWLLVILLLPGLIGLVVRMRGPKQAATTAVAQPAVQPAEATPVVPVPPPPVQPQTAPSLQERALAAVQNHVLPGEQGTVAAYLERKYKEQLSAGYSAQWSVEPLHKSIYIVKYRLTKTRTEPVVYVFQADASSGKLTGALNNIALDLVGKL